MAQRAWSGAVRYHFVGKQGHGLSDQGRVHDAALNKHDMGSTSPT